WCCRAMAYPRDGVVRRPAHQSLRWKAGPADQRCGRRPMGRSRIDGARRLVAGNPKLETRIARPIQVWMETPELGSSQLARLLDLAADTDVGSDGNLRCSPGSVSQFCRLCRAASAYRIPSGAGQ